MRLIRLMLAGGAAMAMVVGCSSDGGGGGTTAKGCNSASDCSGNEICVMNASKPGPKADEGSDGFEGFDGFDATDGAGGQNSRTAADGGTCDGRCRLVWLGAAVTGRIHCAVPFSRCAGHQVTEFVGIDHPGIEPEFPGGLQPLMIIIQLTLIVGRKQTAALGKADALAYIVLQLAKDPHALDHHG